MVKRSGCKPISKRVMIHGMRAFKDLERAGLVKTCKDRSGKVSAYSSYEVIANKNLVNNISSAIELENCNIKKLDMCINTGIRLHLLENGIDNPKRLELAVQTYILILKDAGGYQDIKRRMIKVRKKYG